MKVEEEKYYKKNGQLREVILWDFNPSLDIILCVS